MTALLTEALAETAGRVGDSTLRWLLISGMRSLSCALAVSPKRVLDHPLVGPCSAWATYMCALFCWTMAGSCERRRVVAVPTQGRL
eukprot:14626201-Alexandrium_andersonii.AAC.1